HASRTNSERFVRNGALRFHATPGTHVANIHKTHCNRHAFLSFHRLVTTGTPHDRRVIHSMLHIPSPRQLLHSAPTDFLSAFHRGALTCQTMRNSSGGDFEFRRAVKPPSASPPT